MGSATIYLGSEIWMYKVIKKFKLEQTLREVGRTKIWSNPKFFITIDFIWH